MIKVTIGNIVNSVEVLQKLGKKDFKAKLAWSIARLLKEAEKEVQGFNEARLKLINKYGIKDENDQLVTDDNGNCKIIQENIPDFNKELNDLVDTEVEINANKINMNLLEDVDFTPSDMATLEPFVEFDEE